MEISPEGMDRGERGDGRGFGAQDPWPQRDALAALRDSEVALALREPAFRTDEQLEGFLGSALRRDRHTRGLEEPARPRRHRDPALEAERGPHLRNARAPALLA